MKLPYFQSGGAASGASRSGASRSSASRLPASRSRDAASVSFAGLDLRVGAVSCVREISGFTEEEFPVLRTEPVSYRRELFSGTEQPETLRMERILGAYAAAKDGVFYYPEDRPRGSLSAPAECFAVMNGVICIFPSGQYYDTTDYRFGSMARGVTLPAGTVSFEDGTLYGEPAAGNTLRCPSADLSALRPGDGVTISGCALLPENNKTAVIRETDAEAHCLRFSENCFTVGAESASVSVRTEIPALQGVCVCDNRVWGYAGRTIYASKQGDPFNWSVFDGISTDSWRLSLDGTGDITGCSSFMGFPTFFQEDRVYKIYGSRPANYTLTPGSHTGVRAGAARSVCAVGDTLFYLTPHGMAAWNGGVPDPLPEFGFDFRDAVCASDGKRLCVLSAGRVFRYTPALRLWSELEIVREAGTEETVTDLLDGSGYPVLVGTRAHAPETDPPTRDVRLHTTARGAGEERGTWTEASSPVSRLVLGDYYVRSAEKTVIEAVRLRLRTGEAYSPEQSDPAPGVTVRLIPDGGSGVELGTHCVSGSPIREYFFSSLPRLCDSFRLEITVRGGDAALLQLRLETRTAGS